MSEQVELHNIAYAVVQCDHLKKPQVKKLSGNGIDTVEPLGYGMFMVNFEDGFFGDMPAVQVTAVNNGLKSDHELCPITQAEDGHDYEKRPVLAQVMYVQKQNCKLRVFFSHGGFENLSVSFTITAVGRIGYE